MKFMRLSPWVVLVMLSVIAAAFFPIWPNGVGGSTTMTGYVLSWAGACFKSISAAVIAFVFIRHVLHLDLSEIEDPVARSVAGLGAAVLMAAFIVAIGTGS